MEKLDFIENEVKNTLDEQISELKETLQQYKTAIQLLEGKRQAAEVQQDKHQDALTAMVCLE